MAVVTPNTFTQAFSNTAKKIPAWAIQSNSFNADLVADPTKTVQSSASISGVVKENGVAVPYAWVALIYRRTHVLIARTRAAADGTFSFPTLDPTSNGYAVVAFYPDGGTSYNALVQDWVQGGTSGLTFNFGVDTAAGYAAPTPGNAITPNWNGLLAFHVPSWTGANSSTALAAAKKDGVISGVLKDNGTPIAYGYVGLYYRQTHQLIDRVRTDAGGAFQFWSLDKTVSDYFVLGFYANNSYNALVWDKVRPQ